MSQLILPALIAEANAKETKAVATLQNYVSNAVGIGEPPDVVAECMKLVKDIAEAREIKETVNSLIEQSNKSE